ncbi:hypothetical protein NARC_60124 [Candidatus Nitrosocosmicus arcticus]|uniref:Uncharacterized protein n=1 Tax=Candidatus Nitrosocosmicus arcticus TaxID=2035267 RepID=A0A557SVV1_9ARCH|nr:hypothetical protein NARC_60124 [Candidatus Nitrosocosmicus arcticus]
MILFYEGEPIQKPIIPLTLRKLIEKSTLNFLLFHNVYLLR